MKFKNLIFALTFLGLFAMAMRVSFSNDTWWHLRAGQWMLEQGQILRTDPFSITRLGEPWIYPGWLAQIGMISIYNLAGLPGLNLATALVVVAAFMVLWPVMEGHPLVKAGIIILTASAAGVYWSARPQILSFLLAAVFLFVLERTREGDPRLLIVLPILSALWANLHGGFAIGLLIVGVYFAGGLLTIVLDGKFQVDQIRIAWTQQRYRFFWLGGTLIACIAAVSINPFGPRMLLYPLETVSIGVLRQYIQEWQSPNFHELEVQPFLWIVLILLVVFSVSRKKARPEDLFLLILLAYLSFLAGRNISLFALVAALVLARHLSPILSPYLKGRENREQISPRITGPINLAIVLLVLLAVLVKSIDPLSGEFNQKILEDRMPVNAFGYLEDVSPPGPIFNSYNWGGYLLWHSFPMYLSFVDGRTDLFDDEILSLYLDTWRADNKWQDILRDWKIQLVLIESEAPLAAALEEAGWQRLFADDQAVIYSRADGS